MTRLDLTVDVSGEAGDVDVLVDALEPEHAEDFPGVETGLERVDDGLARLSLSSPKATDLRAAVNAHLRWMATVEDTLAVDLQPDNEVHD